MELTNYEIVYILSNIFGTYIVFRFMGIFFDRTDVNKIVEMLAYIGWFLMITAFYLFVTIPIVMMISNILGFIGITFVYKASLKRSLLSAILIYFIMMCIEIIVAILTGYFDYSVFTETSYSSIWGLICMRILSYVVVVLTTNYRNIKRGIPIPFTYWFCIFLIPSASIYCMLLLFQSSNLKSSQILAGIVLLLLINFSAFILYDVITAEFGERIDKMLLSQQNKYYKKQFELMKISLKARNMEKHDLKNHLSVVEALVRKHEERKALEHIATLMDLCLEGKRYACSGNMVIDSILNFKLQEAEQDGIMVNLELAIPEELNITSFHMTSILGNIIDNAIHATKKLEQNRRIDLKIRYNKGRVIVKIDNSYNGEVVYENDTIVTSHEDKDNHGIGLCNVRAALEKYNGTMEIKHNDEDFSVKLLMFAK